MKIVWNTATNTVTSDAMPFLVAKVHEATTLDDGAAAVATFVPDPAGARVAAWLLRRQAYPTAVKDGAS